MVSVYGGHLLCGWPFPLVHGQRTGFLLRILASHNIGEALTFLIIASIVSVLGWRYGFFGAGIVGLLGALIVWKFFHDTPESKGFPPVNVPKQKKEMSATETADFNKA